MKIILQNRNKKIKINMLLIFVMSMLTLSCSSNNDEEEQTPDIEIPSEETPQEKILGTWKFYLYYNENENPDDGRTYTFFDGGVYVYWSQGEMNYSEGTYSISDKNIVLDNETSTLDIFTDKSITFSLGEYKYEGNKRIESNSKLRAENKQKFIGTWLCDVSYSYGTLTSQLTIKEDGTYTNVYLEDNDKYTGRYYVSEDKIYFEDPSGKDPLYFYTINELSNNHFELDNLYDEPVSAKRQ